MRSSSSSGSRKEFLFLPGQRRSGSFEEVASAAHEEVREEVK